MVGYRHFTDYSHFCNKVKDIISSKDVIISGGASGADSLAERYAKEYGHRIIVFEAQWKKYGPKAGPIRNTKIIESCDVLIAFPSKKGKGTQDSIRKAEKKGMKVYKFWI